MKLNEFLKLNDQAGELNLEIRDYSNGGMRLIESYHIGSHAVEDRVRKGSLTRWKTIVKTINKIEDVYRTGNAYWGIKQETIPNSLLDMEVMHFSFAGKAFSINNGCWELSKITIWLRGNDADALALKKELIKQENSDLDANGQLKGQMSFWE